MYMGDGLLGGFVTGVGFGSAYNTVVDILRTGATWIKWKAFSQMFGYPKMVSIMQDLISAEKDEVHGLSAKGVIDTIFNFVDKTIDFSWIISEAMASQLFIQMIQQSVAYSITNSVAGSIGSMCNVYSGSSHLPALHVNTIGDNIDLADRYVKSYLMASMGLNVPSTAFELCRGVNSRIGSLLSRIISQADSLIESYNDWVTNFYTHYHTMARNRFQDALEMVENLYTRAYGLLEQVANDHLSRLNEQLDTVEGARSWFESGFISEDDFKDICIRVKLEVEASEANFDDYKTEILNSVENAKLEWDSYVTTGLNDLIGCIQKYAGFVSGILNSLFSDVVAFVQAICNEADKIVEDVCAYRNVSQSAKIEYTDKIGVS